MKHLKVYEQYLELENVTAETYNFLDAGGNNLVKGKEYIYSGRVANEKGRIITDDDKIESVRVVLNKCSNNSCYFDVLDAKILGRRISQITLNILDKYPEKTQEFICPV